MKKTKAIYRLLPISTILGVISPILYLARKILIEHGNALYPLPGVIIRFNILIPWTILALSFARFNHLISTGQKKASSTLSGVESSTLLLTLLIYAVLHYLNTASHANYSYSLLGIPFGHVTQYTWLTFISFALEPSRNFKNKLNTLEYNRKFTKLSQSIFLVLILFQIVSVSLTIPKSIKVKLDPNAVFASKQGTVDKLAKLPMDSAIVHPPQDFKWPALSNQIILRYFLFPRTLVSGEIEGVGSTEPLQREFYLVQSRNERLNETWPESIENWLERIFGDSSNLYSSSVVWEGNNDTIYKISKKADQL